MRLAYVIYFTVNNAMRVLLLRPTRDCLSGSAKIHTHEAWRRPASPAHCRWTPMAFAAEPATCPPGTLDSATARRLSAALAP